MKQQTLAMQSGFEKFSRKSLRQMLYRFQDAQQVWRGGITVSDAILYRPSSEMFRNIPTA